MFVYPVNDVVQLRLLTLSDAEEVFRLTDTGRLYLREWLPWVDSTVSVADTREFVQNALRQFAENRGFQAGVVYEGEIVGCVGLHDVNWANRHSSIGYWLAERFQGRGIMTTAVRTAVDLAFNTYQLNRIEIRAAVDNQKSRAVPERLGFEREGVIRQAEWLYDHYVDHAVYGMLSADWMGVSG